MDKINYINDYQISEPYFSTNYLGKFESIMSMGNGYLGLRNAHEEDYSENTCGMYIAGMFNRFDHHEVTELINLPDITHIQLIINHQPFNLLTGEIIAYERLFDYKTGESIRHVHWLSPNLDEVKLTFKKFVSMDNHHLIVHEVTIEAVDTALSVSIKSGINGQVTNSGTQHLSGGVKRFFEQRMLYYRAQTSEKKQTIAIATDQLVNREHTSKAVIQRRSLYKQDNVLCKPGGTVTFKKRTLLKTSQDLAFTGNEDYLEKELLDELITLREVSYNELLSRSQRKWASIWEEMPVTIVSNQVKDSLLLHFARYHLHIMSPTHDGRLNIGAKGLSGEGYKGHTFWDTELFMLPYFTYTFPSMAKSLVNYRIKGLESAKKNAALNGYDGAQYPWESASLEDGEVTPEFGEIDIITGKPTPILTGKLEHHVTADVAFGLLEYVDATNDVTLVSAINQVILEIAVFWSSRAVFIADKDRYELLDVIGPDEYKEHVNNNAYTNYLAAYTMEKALELFEGSKQANELDIKQKLEKIRLVYDRLYLPQPNNALVIPQDDTYLAKKVIDLSKYHAAEQVATIFEDFNLEQVNDIQVSKQADVILLLLLFGHEFSDDVLTANWHYYFPKTLHDSSLSLSSHLLFALKQLDVELAYQLYQKLFTIDLGSEDMKSSDFGIHAAAMGGIWQSVVRGFGGFSYHNDELTINPLLPKHWQSLTYTVVIKHTRLQIQVTHQSIGIQVLNKKPLTLSVNGKWYEINDTIDVLIN